LGWITGCASVGTVMEVAGKASGNKNLASAGSGFKRQAEVQEFTEEEKFYTGRTVAAVMADIGRVRDDAMQEVTDPETGSRAMLSHKDALKALELEGKHLGAFEDRIRLSNPDGTLRPQVIKIIAA
jgi:uncharacterized protein YjbJ (UPF0337 family)